MLPFSVPVSSSLCDFNSWKYFPTFQSRSSSKSCFFHLYRTRLRRWWFFQTLSVPILKIYTYPHSACTLKCVIIIVTIRKIKTHFVQEMEEKMMVVFLLLYEEQEEKARGGGCSNIANCEFAVISIDPLQYSLAFKEIGLFEQAFGRQEGRKKTSMLKISF